MTPMLDGLQVLDFTQVLSGPTATRYLGEMGAEVIKVEVPPAGDLTRSTATRSNGRSGYFVTVNRGKRSVCVDLKDERGIDLVRQLAQRVDVIVENFRPGTMAKLGLGWEELRADNPGLVMCSISGFGQDGSLSHLPGYDGAAQAYAGFTSLNGEKGGNPIAIGAPVGDVLAGVNAVAGILAALLQRQRSGQGHWVQTSVLEAYLQVHDTGLQSYSLTDGELIQEPSGRFHQIACPYGIFRAGDGWIFIAAAADRHWVDLCRAMDRDDLLATDHRWNGRGNREGESDQVNAMIDEWLSGLGGRDRALARLQDHRVPCGPVLGVDEVAENAELRASGAVRVVTDPVLGDLHVPGFPLHFADGTTGTNGSTAVGGTAGADGTAAAGGTAAVDGAHGSASPVAPRLGQHNAEVFGPLVGGPDGVAELIADAVLHERADG